MIKINVKEHLGTDKIERPAALRLRSFIEDNWETTDLFALDFESLNINSVSFFDEAIGKLFLKYLVDDIKKKIKIENLTEFDRQLLNQVAKDRRAQRAAEKNNN